MNTSYSVTFNAVLDPSEGTIGPGTCVCYNAGGTAFVPSTTSNRGTQRTAGVVTFTSFGGKAVQVQSNGMVGRAVTQIPFLAAAYTTPIRVNSAGGLERANPVLAGDEIVGTCDQWGDALVVFGQESAAFIGTLSGDVNGPPSANVVDAVKGIAISATPPTAGQVLTASGASAAGWATPSASTTLAGNVTGPSGSNVVEAVRNIAVSAVAPTTGQVLTATSTSAAAWATPSAITSVTMGGDSSGLSSNATNVAIQNIAVSATAPSTGQVLTATSTSAASWQTPAPPVTSVTMGGQVTGLSSAAVVVAINGGTVPIAGSLTTGNVLQVTGASALGYGPVNLAGGSNFVTGLLPSGNQAAQTLAGDVTGNTGADLVTSITGNGSNAVAMNAAVHLDWASGSLSVSSARLVWTGSSLFVNHPTFIDMYAGGISTTAAGLWFGAQTVTPTTSNYTILSDDGDNLDIRAADQINLRAGTGGVNVVSDLLDFAAAQVTPLISQATASGAATPLTVRAQGSAQSNTSGAELLLGGGNGTGTAKLSGVQLQNGAGATMAQVCDASAAGTNRVVALCVGSALSTQVPTTGGDRVVYLANAATAPTGSPVSGIILYVESDVPKYRTANGFVVTL